MERETSKRGDVSRESRREEQRLSSTPIRRTKGSGTQVSEDRIDLGTETELEQAIRFVQDQHLRCRHMFRRPWRLIKVLQEATRCRDDHPRTKKTSCFGLHIFPTNQETGRHVMVAPDACKDLKELDRQFTQWGENECMCSQGPIG